MHNANPALENCAHALERKVRRAPSAWKLTVPAGYERATGCKPGIYVCSAADLRRKGKKAMRVLVTGGAGYMGSVVAGELLQAGHQVIVFDNLSRGHRQAVPKEAELLVGDLADRDGLDQLLRSRAIDAVMHFAALIEAAEPIKAPEQFFPHNPSDALTPPEASFPPGPKPLLFSSTPALHGNPH